MLKTKRLIIALMLLLVVLLIPNIVKATDTHVTTSTINGVTVNWEYLLNENNQVENLKCTNVGVLSGSISIPSTIDGKTVVTIGNGAFENATGITEVTIPNSVKSIDYGAFADCTSLSKVNLGSIENINFDAFKGCTSLKSITIPKTLKDASISPIFTNCSNLTNITFEEGLTVIPKNLCATTGITEVTIPNSVKSIDYGAFADCSALKKITILDNVEDMGWYSVSDEDSIFKNHNEDLTIYCYKDTMAARYAIKYNIKYVYLPEKSVDTKQYISFPFIIYNGKSSVSLKSGVYDGKYTMYYQFVEVSDEVYNKLNDLKTKYENKEITYEEYFVQYNKTVTKYNDSKWIKTADGSFEQDLSNFTGTKKFALWVKLVMEDKTVYEAQVYTMNGSGQAINDPQGIDKINTADTNKKDTTTAKVTLPNTGKVLLLWIIGIVTISAVVAHIRYKKLYIK